MLAGALAAAVALGVVFNGQSSGRVGCEQEKLKEGAGGVRGIGLDREDSRSAMWPNRDRPSECFCVE